MNKINNLHYFFFFFSIPATPLSPALKDRAEIQVFSIIFLTPCFLKEKGQVFSKKVQVFLSF